MKTIVVPTDYSETADNALNYALELAKFSKAKIVLMHAYQVPVPTAEVPVLMITPVELESENQKRMKNLEKKINHKAKEVNIESVTRVGFTVEEIQNVIKEKNADLVIMGITGMSKAGAMLIGSHTSSLMNQTKTPVLVVPKDARFKEVKRIVLACNYHEEINNSAIDKIKEFATLFNAKVLVLDVEKPEAIPMYENTVAAGTLENVLKGVDHAMFFSSAEDISEGINEFVDDHNCDWVAMIPHKHNIFSRIFQQSNAKRMAFHSHVPLLSVHD